MFGRFLLRGNLRCFEFNSPKVGSGSEKLNTNALTAVPGFADEYDPAFLLFLRDGIFEHEHLAAVDFVAESQQATMRVDDHGFANFTKFLSAMCTAMNV